MLDRPLDCAFEQPRATPEGANTGLYSLTARYLGMGWRYRVLFGAVVLSIVVLGTGVVLSLKRSFMAAATVVVTTQISDPLSSSDTNRALEDDELATQAALIESRDVAALVLKELPPPEAPKGHDWRHFLCSHGVKFGCNTGTETTSNSVSTQDRQIDGLLASVTAEPQPRSRVISVGVKADT
ncbi:MAG TPA: hypothetical protein DEP42_00660, partial [Ruminococcaceae bacterium]|nr:hypothetical protein [Oscillospiraceae bacterium]